MRLLAIAFVLLLCSQNVIGKEWSDREKQIYMYYAGVTIADGLQSYSAMQHPCNCFREANPIYGDTISDGEIIASTAFSLWAMHWMIEQDAPEWLLWTVVGGRLAVVVNNHMVGARINVRI